MAKTLFGTDGIRGVAGQPPLDPKTVTAIGIALGDDLVRQGLGSKPVLMGMDTRESGPAIAAQLADGLRRAGVAATFAGVITTPGVAWLTRTGDYAAGVMISASHNPFQDNGIKVFARRGYKLPDAEEHAIEEEIAAILPGTTAAETLAPLTPSCDIRPYLDHILGTLRTRLNGLRVVLDCGNGAASALAPALFREAGAEVTAICNTPDGLNINLHCGALHLEALRAKVLETGADAGVAFDGDADRALLVASSGRIVDGDAILLIAARQMQRDGHLPGNVVVSTVMSNLGLEMALEKLGVQMLRTPVGDKYVLEEMLARGAAVGGEQSGHVIFNEYATTGDGMLTALRVIETAVREKTTLDALAADLVVFPQVLVNVRVKERRPLDQLPAVTARIKACEAEMEGLGRVLVRYSGTELLLRVMVEGPEQAQIERVAGDIADAVRAELG
jgi:phosphoglucosamine mutase